jgi:eukaryotic-like serine/threonine-protein kinase
MLQGRLPSRYRVIEEVGQGGMAVVYKAHDETLKREVAVKVLHAHLLSETESKTRLEREAQAVAKLHHDNIVQIFDYSGDNAGASYIVTEFIEGQTLKQFIANRKPPPPEVAALIAIEVGGALMHAHSLGIIHRDVKPENVMVRKDGLLKLMDFGVAQIMDLERMTVTGQLLGSPAYMAPETLEGKQLDVRTDVFSVGIMLYQLSTGALPFSGRNPHEVLKRIAEGKFADPRTVNRQVADRLAKIIARALARRPEDRYPCIGDLLTDLGGFVADAGLTSARDELQSFFREPDRYESTIGPRMLSALVVAGKQERAARRTARALELWNRALSMDPSNREVLIELKRLENRQHLKRGSLVAASVAALAAGAFFILNRAGSEEAIRPAVAAAPPAGRVLTNTTPPAAGPLTESPTVSPLPKRGGDPVTPGRSAPATVRPPRLNGRAERGRQAVSVPSAGPRETRTLTLVPVPARADIWVDNVFWAAFNPGSNKLSLDWSRDHVLEFKNDCCATERLEVGPSKDPIPDNRLLVRFTGLPATLIVRTNPLSRGKVGVLEILDSDDGGRRPLDTWEQLGQPLTVSFVGDSNMKKKLLLTVKSEGDKPPRNYTVEISAGKKLEKIVPLE